MIHAPSSPHITTPDTLSDPVALALELDPLPNAPYSVAAANAAVRALLEQYDPVVRIAEDNLALYAQYTKGAPPLRLVIDSHLDHPAFVVRTPGSALAIGSIGTPAHVPLLNSLPPVAVEWFDTIGNMLGNGTLNLFGAEGEQLTARARLESEKALPINAQARLPLQPRREGNRLLLRTADNQAVTAVALSMLDWLVREQIEANVTFIFTKLEEVKQASATLIARRNATPFGSFDQRTRIIVLEAALIAQTDASRTIGDFNPTYEGGVVVRIADDGLVYRNGNQVNEAESLLLHAAERAGQDYQHAPLINHSDASSYILFSACPHVMCLTVPCRNKHNLNMDGHFTYEEIAATDLHSMLRMLQEATRLAQSPLGRHPACRIDMQAPYPANTARWQAYRHDWLRTALWAQSRLQHGHLFPTSPTERVQFIIGSLWARATSRTS